jgi:hypothetical protein
MIAPETQQAILVLGMHRSGTSALAGMLSLCGASLPATLMPPADYNPKGFFESLAIFRAHQQLLTELGSSWDDLSPLPEGWLDSTLGRQQRDSMAALVEEEFGKSHLLVLKDPRICRLVPFWTEVLDSLNINFSFAFPVRNPLEIATSLRAAQNVSLNKGLLLWLSHFLQAERDTRPYKRSFLSYEQLLVDWRKTAERLKKDLGVQLPRMTQRGGAEIDAFLQNGLRHQVVSTEELNARPDISDWIKDAYGWALQATRNKPIPKTKIDHVFVSLEKARTAFIPSSSEENWESHDASPENSKPAEPHKTSSVESKSNTAPSLYNADKDEQTKDLTDCIKLLLVWIASQGPGHGTATDELKTLLVSLDSPSALSLTEATKNGLAVYEKSVLASVSEERSQHEEQRRLLAQEVSVLEERYRQTQDTVSRAQQDVLHAQSSARQLRDELQDRDRKFSQVRSTLHQSSTRVEELERSVKGYQAGTAELNTRLVQHTEAVAHLTKQLEDRKDRVTGLQAEMQAARQQLSSMIPAKETITQEAQKLRRLLDERNKALRTLQEAHTQSQIYIAGKNRSQQELEDARSGLERKVAAVSEERERLRRELQASRGETQQASDGVRQSSAVVQQQKQAIQDLTSQRNAATGEVQRLHGELSRLRREKAAAPDVAPADSDASNENSNTDSSE